MAKKSPPLTDQTNTIVRNAIETMKQGLLDPNVTMAPMIVLETDDLHVAMVLAKGLGQHKEVLTKLAQAFHPTRLMFVYDGYATLLDAEKGPCPECLGEDSSECAECCGTGVAAGPQGKQDAIVCIEMLRGKKPIVHYSSYVTVKGAPMFEPPVTLDMNDGSGKWGDLGTVPYPVLNEEGEPE